MPNGFPPGEEYPTWREEEERKAARVARERAKRLEERYAERMEALRQRLLYGQAWGGIQPQPRYRPGFQQMMGGLAGARPYLDWFESMFPSLVREFEATLPTYKGFITARGAAREAEEIGETWADWLRGKRKEVRERWYSLSPWQRGERPGYFAPRIQTLSF